MSDGAIIVSDPNKRISVVSPGAKITQVVTSGTRGPAGKSSYEIWLEQGNSGTIEDYFASLSGGHYTYTQMNPETVWAIDHNLEFYPNVTAFDSAGTEIVGAIEHQSVKSLTITFTSATGGTAHLS